MTNASVHKTLAKTGLIAGLLWAASPAVALAAGVGNPENGFKYAREQCAGCHAIARGAKRSRLPRATPFQVFVDTPGVNRLPLIVFFRTPHPTMPNLVVSGEHVDDVIAYMLSLQKPPQ